MSPLILGFLVMVSYGLFLLIRALFCLYRAGARKLVYVISGFMISVPPLIWLVAKIPADRMSIWFALPTLVLCGFWVCLGYFVEGYRKKKEKGNGLFPVDKPLPTPSLIRRNVLILVSGLVLWCYGAFIGIANRQLEIVLLCICIFLLTTSLASLWKYRKF
ncbi:MAG: hypothetical protein FWG61_03785 [Firmicutes bacterium]|nr:hypothetical protein [Bacillota bacterium]